MAEKGVTKLGRVPAISFCGKTRALENGSTFLSETLSDRRSSDTLSSQCGLTTLPERAIPLGNKRGSNEPDFEATSNGESGVLGAWKDRRHRIPAR